MEMGNLLCGLIGVVLALVMVLMIVRRALRPMAAASAYRNVAWRLGLESDTRGLSLWGRLDDRWLFVGAVQQDDEGRSVTHYQASLRLRRPLGLGLRVRPRPIRARLSRRPPPGQVRLGDPEVDDAFTVQGHDEAAVLSLMSDEVRDALAQLADRWPDLRMDDRGITVHLKQPPTRDAQLTALVEGLQKLGQATDRARLRGEPPAVLADRSAPWQALAARLGVAFHPALPALQGRLGTRVLHLHPDPTPDGFRAELILRFPDAPDTGLYVAPESHIAEAWERMGGQDIEVGAQPFDDDFVVKAYAPPTARTLLDEAARSALQALDGAGDVVLTDREVQVRDLPLEPEALETVVDQAVALGDALGR